jgi:D-glycero-alpha-D-manno-heptose-7-phosphate kinase
MIVARAPLRIPLAGGGTDLPFYAERRGGHVVSVAIDRYAYAILVGRADTDEYLVSCDRVQRAGSLDRISHPYVRAALRHLCIPGGLEVHCAAEVEGKSGLGISSSIMVALLCALHALRQEPTDPAALAREATVLEREVLDEAGGVQDQYMAAYGGLREIHNTTRSDVTTTALELQPEVCKALEDNLLLFSTGVQRRSDEIVRSQLEQNSESEILEHYDKIKQAGLAARDGLLCGDLRAFARALHRHWTVKRQLSDRMSSELLDSLYQRGLEHGALGGKVVGAGGGGCLLFYVEDGHDRFVRAMERLGLRHLEFRFAWKGAESLWSAFGPP